MMEAVRTYDTLVNFNVTTRRYNQENSKLHDHFYFLSPREIRPQSIKTVL
jgi:hypothetical protein